MNYIGNSKVVAQFVADILTDSRFDSALITITIPARSEDCSVSIVTDISLADIAEKKALHYSFQLTSISKLSTQAG